MAILTAFTAVLLLAKRPGMGRILFTVSEEHGIHAGDVPIVALWVVGLVCGALLLRDSRAR
jgi:hypothetical protein